nr:MAG TPA: hypothetical protein [Caudoviricetes sp.]
MAHILAAVFLIKKRKKIRLLVYFLAQPKNFLVVFTGGGKKCLRTRIKCFLVHFLLSKKRKYIYFLLIFWFF